MHWTDLSVEHFGILNDFALRSLSPGITVVWGSNGCGKSTLVQFLRGMMTGFQHSAFGTEAAFPPEGTLWLTTGQNDLILHRTQLAGGRESLQLTDASDGRPAEFPHPRLPEWITPAVYGDMFTVGDDEANRFELLTQLVMKSGFADDAVAGEIRTVELALRDLRSERDGWQLPQQHGRQAEQNGQSFGIRHRIADLREQHQHWLVKLNSIRRPGIEPSQRRTQLMNEITELSDVISNIDARVAEISKTISQLEGRRQLQGQGQEYRPSMDRAGIESRLHLLHRRQERWQAILKLIIAANEALPEDAGHDHNQKRTEISLRENMTQQAAAFSGEAEELLLGRHSQDCVSRVLQLLDAGISGLQGDLARSVDILPLSDSALMALAQIDRQLGECHAERTRLVVERGHHEETRHARRAVLERTQQEVPAAAVLEQIDALQARLAEVETNLELLEDRRQLLDETERSLQAVIERLKHRCQPQVLQRASAFMRRLTDGDCRQIVLTSGTDRQLLFCTEPHPEPQTISQLSRGTRHQAALALRLALIELHAETSERLPLVLDDVFITSDDARAAAVADLLTEVAGRGQQILFFTCQHDVRDLFVRCAADVRRFDGKHYLGEPAPLLKAYVEEKAIPVPPPMIQETLDDPPETSPIAEPCLPAPQPVVSHPPSPAINTQPGGNWLFYLELDHHVDDLAGISLGELQAFRAAGIHTIADLLFTRPDQLEERTRAAGYLLSRERLQALRAQAELTCRVPMLRRSDAALLYAAGIRSADELSLLRPETLYDRIIGFQRTEAGSRYRRAGRLIDRQQAINWARWGQYVRPLPAAATPRTAFSIPASPIPSAFAESAAENRLRRRARLRQSGGLSRQRRVIVTGDDAARQRARRLARRRRLAERRRSVSGRSMLPGTAQTLPPTGAGERPVAITHAAGRDLRFFLSRSSDIEVAPSIGPKTAESLRALGVLTVDQLLSISAERLAHQLNRRRITAGVIRLWQAQARLMCQVPELRGHDVQLLVACGVSDPDDLAQRNPAELLALVGPFADTVEGVRILRNGPRPDLREVRDWVRCASSARPFRAAS